MRGGRGSRVVGTVARRGLHHGRHCCYLKKVRLCLLLLQRFLKRERERVKKEVEAFKEVRIFLGRKRLEEGGEVRDTWRNIQTRSLALSEFKFFM